MLAVTASVTPEGVVLFAGDSQPDALQVFVENGFLKYNGATPDAATLNIAVGQITALNIDLGGGEDLVEFGGTVPLDISMGGLSVLNVDLVHINQSIHTGLDQEYFDGNLVIGAGTFTLAADGDMLIEGQIDAEANALPSIFASSQVRAAVSGQDFLVWQRGLGRTSGASRASGDMDGDGDVDGGDVTAWQSEFGANGGYSPLTAGPGQGGVSGQDFLAWQRGLGTPSGATRANGDMDGDGDVDGSDVSAWQSEFGADGSHPAQSVSSGQNSVSGQDFLAWQRGLGATSGATRANGDMDGDGDVDGDDMSAWRLGFGDVVPAAAANGLVTLTIDAGATVEFKAPIGALAPLSSLTIDAGVGIVMGAGQLVVDGNSTTFNSPLILSADLIINDAGDVTFNDTVNGDGNGPWSLTVNTPGVTTFNGLVGNAFALESLLTDAPGSTKLNILPAPATPSLPTDLSVRTTGFQTYNDDVILMQDTVLVSGGDVTFAKTVNGTVAGAQYLEVRSPGVTEFRGLVGNTVALESLLTDAPGSTKLNILPAPATPSLPTDLSVRTTGFQTYNDDVILLQDTVLVSGGDVTFAKTVNGTAIGQQYLEVRSPGVTEFRGLVGNAFALESLLTDAAGSTKLNILPAPATPSLPTDLSVRTTSFQTYNDDVVLLQDTVLVSGGDATFAKTVNGTAIGQQYLEVRSPGVTEFRGLVGNTFALESLLTDAAGSTKLNIQPPPSTPSLPTDLSVRTTGFQTYNDDIVLMQDTVLVSGGDVTFAKTVNGTVAGAQYLEVRSPGVTEFRGLVGNTFALESLLTDAPGSTKLNILPTPATPSLPTDLSVRTTSFQTYNDEVVLMQDTVLVSGGDVTFAKTVNGTVAGAQYLEVRSAGVTEFRGLVGNAVALESLQTDAAGSTKLNILPVPAMPSLPTDLSVRTTSFQTYNDDVILLQDTVLVSGGDVTFAKTVNGTVAGAQYLEVRSPGVTEFRGLVGNTFALESLLTDAPGSTKLNILPPPATPSLPTDLSVRTTGFQTYNDDIVLMQDTVLISDGDVTFAKTVNGTVAGAQYLEVRSPGVTRFKGTIGTVIALESLETDASGETQFDISAAGVDVMTIGDQIYNDFVTLLRHTSLDSGHDVYFDKTVDSDALGPWDLIADAEEFVEFNGNVGVIRRLRDVIVRTGGPLLTGTFTIDVLVWVNQDIDITVRESNAASVTDDVTLLPTAGFDATRDVHLRAGDDLTFDSGATIDADGMLTIDGDFGDNDAFPTTITMTTATPMTTDAVGALRGGGGVTICGGDDSTDHFNLQANRLVTANAVVVQGYRTIPSTSGNDDFLLVFKPNATLTVGSLTIDGGGNNDQDRFTIDHSKDTAGRKVAARYDVDYALPPPDLIDNAFNGSNSTLTGLGTDSGLIVRGMEKYLLQAGAADHDSILIQSKDQTNPNSPAFVNFEQRILVSDDPADFSNAAPAYYQWIIQGWESGQLVGSNVRDAILNGTDQVNPTRPLYTGVAMLIEGSAGNDTLVGGATTDVIFSGAGAPFFRVGQTDTILQPIYYATGLPPTPPLAPEGVVRRGDVVIGAGGNDFLFADVDLFRAGPLLWGQVTLDVSGESDLINGAGQGTSAIGQTNHGAQYGAGDIARNITGVFIDGGATKDVMTWLRASPMIATSANLNALIEAAFRANMPAINKVGLLSPPFNALLNDFDIEQRPFPGAAIAATSVASLPSADQGQALAPSSASLQATTVGAANVEARDEEMALVFEEVDAAFARWSDDAW